MYLRYFNEMLEDILNFFPKRFAIGPRSHTFYQLSVIFEFFDNVIVRIPEEFFSVSLINGKAISCHVTILYGSNL